MKFVAGHISRCCIAGIVALLPIGGLVLSVAYMESSIAASWLANQPFYFPGMGLIAVAVIVYLMGLFVSTVLGRWLWSWADRVLDNLPALGQLYQTLKQILGYGQGKDAMFHQVVLVPSRDFDAVEVGLVTNQLTGADGQPQLVVFIPGAPNPTTGRLVVIGAERVQPSTLPVSEALKALVSVGKTPLTADRPAGPT